ncbi:hypothetical protein [Nitratireductor thuwali]|uniref:Gene transfer agent family protein n=1 Tax=Nitratireductor thuwali TaxID=2267699 RepID=A0ABY5MND9_9HYPH|nr:hypothetical protein NTH_04008 [Nitratireductor thuwali]
MANRHKGEVSAKIDGTEYTLRIATNEWCMLEDEFDKTTDEILNEFYQTLAAGKLRMHFIRKLFRAALIGQKPEITLEEAGSIMSDLGLVEAGALLGKVVTASMPDVKEDDAAKARPPKAAKAKA